MAAVALEHGVLEGGTLHHMCTLGAAVARCVSRPIRSYGAVRMVVHTCACARHTHTLTGMCAEAREALLE